MIESFVWDWVKIRKGDIVEIPQYTHTRQLWNGRMGGVLLASYAAVL